MNNLQISFDELKSAITSFNATNSAVGIVAKATFAETMEHIKTVMAAYAPAGIDDADLPGERIAVLQDLFPNADDSITEIDAFIASISEKPANTGNGNISEVAGNAESFLTDAELAVLKGHNIMVTTKNNGEQPFQVVPQNALPLAPTKSMSACIENVRFTSRTGTSKKTGNVIGHLLAEGLLSNGSEFSQDFYEGFLDTTLGRRVFGRNAKTWADPEGNELTDLPAANERVDIYMTKPGTTNRIDKIYVQVSGISPVAKQHVFITDDPAYVAPANAKDSSLVFDYTMPGASAKTPCVAVVYKSTLAFANGRINKKLSGQAAELFKKEMDKSFEARADIAGTVAADQAVMANEEVLVKGQQSRARIAAAGSDIAIKTQTARRQAMLNTYLAANLDPAAIALLMKAEMEAQATIDAQNAKA